MAAWVVAPTVIPAPWLKLRGVSLVSTSNAKTLTLPIPSSLPLRTNRNRVEGLICRAEKEYKFPNPIPEFADSETEKFEIHMKKKLSKKNDVFGNSVDQVVTICSEKMNEFLHTEYGGPGTLLVNPFIDMADTINEKGLPGGPQAARAAVKWAQAYVDKDWEEWTTTPTRDD